MTTFTVGHVKEKLPNGVIGHKCDRSSMLGNPFALESESQRDDVCDGYLDYFVRVVDLSYQPVTAAKAVAQERGLTISRSWRFPLRSAFLSELKALEESKASEVVLRCWCRKTTSTGKAAKRCHCDTVVGHLNGDLKVQVLGGRSKTVNGQVQPNVMQGCLF